MGLDEDHEEGDRVGKADDLDKRLELWLAAARYRQLADAVQAMAPPGDTGEDRQARWLVWLRSYAARLKREVVRELPDPERGPNPTGGTDPRWSRCAPSRGASRERRATPSTGRQE